MGGPGILALDNICANGISSCVPVSSYHLVGAGLFREVMCPLIMTKIDAVPPAGH